MVHLSEANKQRIYFAVVICREPRLKIETVSYIHQPRRTPLRETLHTVSVRESWLGVDAILICS